MTSYLNVKRQPYEEPYHTQLFFTISNGQFAGALDIYCNVEDIAEIGRRLKGFPSKVGDEFRHEYGSEVPGERMYRYFLLRAYTVGGLGQCALQVVMNRNETGMNDAYCRFSIPAEAAALNRLGDLFERFAKLEHLELEWAQSDGRLYEDYQQPIGDSWVAHS